ncbi:hypothetical protein PF005_g9657 [Phytophthora fragariae]|uniref:PWWP domain-containing protein n=1 Tax=Phytophthora fragariae TaxID=53985 RepID=A0A6A3F4E6_9STRA|nr:hypothetical protein PF003_g16001 [Phytophthora fragariae]KAE8939526.1 hypothetical protein PF009_g10628 [Phytophthora fragariae]KAE9013684.1 hypothetical protein PF011_g8374 [Phytophthora fragariae]KAE9115976.1 hypothetical protein PF007_g9828 [Phytophthora fragariae]KAE9116517.1 hypothetical protein PF010_g8934 [Phytophthora fragariae]
MTPKRRTSNSSTRNSSHRQSVVLTKGDWLDVMDSDGVWNVARVLSVPSPEEVEVMYDGWPEEYDEVVRVDSHRVAPFHTFTWAVKCWVKYLNWPMWPSVITIRTPGTLKGVKNLQMENRLNVDFLDDPNFAKRDRCWEKKRQVKTFDDNYDANRMQTNGAQFERALEFILRSDATTKMPRFAKGTLPLQYEDATTDSVEGMRKSMGVGLWYRNFANNKERHMKTHVYEVIGDDEADTSSGSGKLTIRRPKTSSTTGEQLPTHSKQKKKRPLPAKKQSIPVKIEEEPLMEDEAPYDLGAMGSSDSCGDSERERQALLMKKRRKNRPPVSPTAIGKESRNERHVISPKETNVAISMPRHVTVLMDDIIVDDDEDSGSSGVAKPRSTRVTSAGSSAMRSRAMTATSPVQAKTSTSRKSPDKKRAKMAARRSIPPIRSFAASAKPKSSRHSNSDDDSEEEKAVPRNAVNDVEQHKLSPRHLVESHRSEHFEKQKSRFADVSAPRTPRQPKPTKRPKPKAVLPLIEQRITVAQELLRDLDKEKQHEAKSVVDQERKKTSARLSSFSPRGSRDENRPIIHRKKTCRPESSDLSFLRPGSESYESQGIDTMREETSFDFGLETEELGHSFLSADKAFSFDSQESKGVATPFDEPMVKDPPRHPKESACSKKAEPKTRKVKSVAGSKHRAEEKTNSDDGREEKSQEVRRHCCVMRAGLKGTLEVVDEKAESKKLPRQTVINVSRKFGEPVKEASYVSTSSTDSMLRISTPSVPRDDADDHADTALTPPPAEVFSSSEGFSMDKWLKRSLVTNLRRTGMMN